MKKVLGLVLLLLSLQPLRVLAQPQFSHPIISFSLSLQGYAGRFDTTRRGGEVVLGTQTTVGMDVSLSTTDTALGAAGGLAADYGWFSHLEGGNAATRFNQLSISVDTTSAQFTNVTVIQHDTVHGPALDATVVTDRLMRLTNVPFQMTQPGVFTATLAGEALSAHLLQPVVVHVDRYFRQQLMESYDLAPSADSTANASVTVSVEFPTASVAKETSGPGIAVWPNPAASELHIEGAGQQSLSIFDALGRKVSSGSAPVMDIQSLPAGSYFIELQGRVSRFVVAR